MSKHLISLIRVFYWCSMHRKQSRNPFQYNEHSTNMLHHNTIFFFYLINVLVECAEWNASNRRLNGRQSETKMKWREKERDRRRLRVRRNAQQAARKLFKKFDCGVLCIGLKSKKKTIALHLFLLCDSINKL